MNIRLSADAKLGALFAATSLVATFAQHIVTSGWGSSLPITTLLTGMFIHFVGLSLLFVASCMIISRSQKYFLGHENEDVKRGEYHDIHFYFLILIMMLSLATIILSAMPLHDINE